MQTYSHGCAKSIAGRGTFQTGSSPQVSQEEKLPRLLLVSCAVTLAFAHYVQARSIHMPAALQPCAQISANLECKEDRTSNARPTSTLSKLNLFHCDVFLT